MRSLPTLDAEQRQTLQRALRIVVHQGKANSHNARRNAIAELLRVQWPMLPAKQAKDIAERKLNKLLGNRPRHTR